MISDDAVKGNTNPEGFLVFGVFLFEKENPRIFGYDHS